MNLADRYRYHIYDCLMIAGALHMGAATLWSEDMQHGRRFGDLTIQNPFLPQ